MRDAGGEEEGVYESLPGENAEASAGDYTSAVARRPLRVEFDYAEYAHFFARFDLTEEQKRAHFAALCEIMLAFAALGFGIHPAQQACGNRHDSAEEPTLAALFGVECEDNRNIHELADAPGGAAAGESK